MMGWVGLTKADRMPRSSGVSNRRDASRPSTSGSEEASGDAAGSSGLDLESDFWRGRAKRTLILRDQLTARLGVMGFLGLWALGTGVGAHAAKGVVSLATFNIVAACRRDWYLRQRSRILPVVRTAVAILYGHALSRLRFRFDTPPLVDVLARGTWPCLLGGALGLQLSFGQHMVVQTVAFLASSASSGGMCADNFPGEAYTLLFRNLERRIDALGATLMPPAGEPDMRQEEALPRVRASATAHSSCWAVLSFVNLWLGWVLPNLAIWYVERRARMAYLEHRRLSAKGNFVLPGANLIARALWCFNIVFFLEVSWCVLKKI